MSVSATDENQLGTYLKDRRTELDPAGFGFSGRRRRTSGLRREEVAHRANISVAWYIWLVLVGAMSLLSRGICQEPSRDIPPDSHFSASEQGWTCNNGFSQVAAFCMPDGDDVPSKSASEVFDGQWRCRSGYQRAGSYCVPVTPPAHASFVGDGDRWECDWGFQKVGSRCQEITPPAHGYLDASGHDWVCYPGFERISEHCVPAPGVAPAPEVAPARTDEAPSGTH